MTNFFRYDASGQKRGPFNEQQLQALAAHGKILPTTPLETDTGYKGTAGQIPGLQFNTAAPSPFTQTQPPPSVNYPGTRNPKSRIVAAFLALFLGHLGIHRFYLNEQEKGADFLIRWFLGVGTWFVGFLFGEANQGGIVFIILSIAGIGILLVVAFLALADFFRFLTMRDEDFDMKYNT